MTYRAMLAKEVGGRDVGLWQPPTHGRAALLLGNTPQGWYGTPSGQARHLADEGWSTVTVATPNWGNSTDMASIDAALVWLDGLGVDTDQVLIVAWGQGAVAALNWGLRNHARVAGMSLQSPIIDLAERWTRVTADRTSLEAAYGGSTSTFNSNMPTWNPAHLHRQMLCRSLLGDRLKLWWSSADTDTPPAVTSALATAFMCSTGSLASADPTAASPGAVLDTTATATAAWDQRPARAREAAWRQWMTDSPAGQGYKGGDAIRSTLLADGREFYCSADNFIGIIDADGTYNAGVLPRRNAFILVSTAGVFSQAYGAGGDLPLPPQGDPWYWPICHCLEGSNLQVAGWKMTLGGNFGHFVDNVIFTINPAVLPTVTITATTLLAQDETTTVTYLLRDGSFIYVLCTEYVGGLDNFGVSSVTHTRLARVPTGSLTTVSAWQWWDGDSWSTSRADAAPLTAGGQTILGDACVRRTSRGFVLAAMTVTEGAIRLYRSGYPQGPWTLYDTVAQPEVGHSRYGATGVGYHPAFHPQLDPSDGELMLTWNGNNFGTATSPIGDMDPDFFRPHHLVVPAPPFLF